MKASELIIKLREAINEHGDLPVNIEDGEHSDGYSVDKVELETNPHYTDGEPRVLMIR